MIYRNYLKRFFDIICSMLALIILSPLFFILVVMGMFFMKGNPFFVQSRPGKNEKIFKMIKFRTMSNQKDMSGNFLPDAQRINRYGSFLRSSSMDELPELINILKGDMALIGPRPQLVKDMVFMSAEQRRRHCVRPGLSGLAQVNGRNEISWEEKLSWDLKYLDEITFLGDVRLIIKTIGKVFKRESINRIGTVSDMDFGDWLLKENKVSKEEYDKKQKEAIEILQKG